MFRKLQSQCWRVFAEGLNSWSCHILFKNCLKELEAKVVNIYKVANTTEESQIKEENQLDLTSSVDYITKSLMSTRTREKNKQIKCLQEHVSFLENKNHKKEQQIDIHEQRELPSDTWDQRNKTQGYWWISYSNY